MKRRAFLTLPIIGAIAGVAKRCRGAIKPTDPKSAMTMVDFAAIGQYPCKGDPYHHRDPKEVVAWNCRDGGTCTLADGTVRAMLPRDRPIRIEDWETGETVKSVVAYDSRDYVVLSYVRDDNGRILRRQQYRYADPSIWEPRIQIEVRRLRLLFETDEQKSASHRFKAVWYEEDEVVPDRF